MILNDEELTRLVIDEIRLVRAELSKTPEQDENAGKDRAEWYVERAIAAKGAQGQLPEALDRLNQLWLEV